MLHEKWKDVNGFEGFYRISNLGNVLSLHTYNGLKPHNRKAPINKKRGYRYIVLNARAKKANVSLHRLLAKHFVPNPNNYPCVNHVDGNKLNNSIDNLQWCTYKQNAMHAERTGLMNHLKGELCPASKLKKSQVIKILRMRKSGYMYGYIAKKLNIKLPTVASIITRRNWKHVTI